MQEILRRVLDRLDAIAEQHGGVGDSDGVLFTDEGDRLAKETLAEFVPAANRSAAETSRPLRFDRPASATSMTASVGWARRTTMHGPTSKESRCRSGGSVGRGN
jgi:hypothetical protein